MQIGRVMALSIPPSEPEAPKSAGVRTSAHGKELSEAERTHIADQWYADNRKGVDSWNAYLKEHGLPFEDDSLF